MELWDLAKASSRTPWEALEDEHLEFNVSVMRGAREARRIATELAAQKGELPIERALEAVREEE